MFPVLCMDGCPTPAVIWMLKQCGRVQADLDPDGRHTKSDAKPGGQYCPRLSSAKDLNEAAVSYSMFTSDVCSFLYKRSLEVVCK